MEKFTGKHGTQKRKGNQTRGGELASMLKKVGPPVSSALLKMRRNLTVGSEM